MTKISQINNIKNYLSKPVDISSMAIFRIFFGIIIIYEGFRYVNLQAFTVAYLEHPFNFKFTYFEWIEPLSLQNMQILHIILGMAGIFICLGLLYHIAIIFACAIISYLFLFEASNYLNHIYLIIVFSLIMLFIPCHRAWSLHAYFRKNIAKNTIPYWCIWLVRFQIGLVYFYAALAKMNVDWLNGMPLLDWAQTYIISSPIAIYFLVYGGLLYDLIIIPMLLIPRFRMLGFCLSIGFHLSNHFMFNIGVFPWFMMAATTLFFDPDWASKLLSRIRKKEITYAQDSDKKKSYTIQNLGLLILGLHIFIQIIIPLRHFIYPNYVSWTEEGHLFSWQMKLRQKEGSITFWLKDPSTGQRYKANQFLYLTKRQNSKMATRPDLILQFAHFLRDQNTLPGETPIEVYADTKISLNGRKPQRLIDPSVDLGKQEKKLFGTDNWILPLTQTVWNAEHKKNRFSSFPK